MFKKILIFLFLFFGGFTLVNAGNEYMTTFTDDNGNRWTVNEDIGTGTQDKNNFSIRIYNSSDNLIKVIPRIYTEPFFYTDYRIFGVSGKRFYFLQFTLSDSLGGINNSFQGLIVIDSINYSYSLSLFGSGSNYTFQSSYDDYNYFLYTPQDSYNSRNTFSFDTGLKTKSGSHLGTIYTYPDYYYSNNFILPSVISDDTQIDFLEWAGNKTIPYGYAMSWNTVQDSTTSYYLTYGDTINNLQEYKILTDYEKKLINQELGGEGINSDKIYGFYMNTEEEYKGVGILFRTDILKNSDYGIIFDYYSIVCEEGVKLDTIDGKDTIVKDPYANCSLYKAGDKLFKVPSNELMKITNEQIQEVLQKVQNNEISINIISKPFRELRISNIFEFPDGNPFGEYVSSGGGVIEYNPDQFYIIEDNRTTEEYCDSNADGNVDLTEYVGCLFKLVKDMSVKLVVYGEKIVSFIKNFVNIGNISEAEKRSWSYIRDFFSINKVYADENVLISSFNDSFNKIEEGDNVLSKFYKFLKFSIIFILLFIIISVYLENKKK